jgi:hypothetical protein
MDFAEKTKTESSDLKSLDFMSERDCGAAGIHLRLKREFFTLPTDASTGLETCLPILVPHRAGW